jgi:hypothetical protein
MQTLAKFSRLILLAGVLAFLPSAPVHAGTCSNPTGNEADMTYNRDYHTMQFCNGTTWMSMAGGGGGSSGGLTLISTKTASASASLQFTNLPTSYNTLFLNCLGLLGSVGTGSIQVKVGEGATPTWETGSHYTVSLSFFATGMGANPAGSYSTTDADLTGNNPPGESTTIPGSIKLYIDGVASASRYKMATFFTSIYTDTSIPSMVTVAGSGYWNNDTNPVAALEVVPTSGTVTGTCSLYGLN